MNNQEIGELSLIGIYNRYVWLTDKIHNHSSVYVINPNLLKDWVETAHILLTFPRPMLDNIITAYERKQ